MQTEAEKQTAWNKQIIADMRAYVATLEKAIAGKGDAEKVRPMIGDAHPMLVSHWRSQIEKNLGWIADIEAEM